MPHRKPVHELKVYMMTAYLKGCFEWEQTEDCAFHAEGYYVFCVRRVGWRY